MRVSLAAFEGFSTETGGEYDAYSVGEDQPMKLYLTTDQDLQVREFLRKVAGVSVSDSPVSSMLKRLGWSRKKLGRQNSLDSGWIST